MPDERFTGFVQSYNRARGYGFILPLGRQEPVFVTRDALEGPTPSLSEEQQVTFTIEFHEGRLHARHVLP
ncbi:cold shock domain-containing protein [Streptomyces sp. NPDC006512]|uniref:cold-shock protein n=1 Tax=Streptomyces sp. NPDC006512 TaxID=3154307 RepID=UPI0033A892E8